MPSTSSIPFSGPGGGDPVVPQTAQPGHLPRTQKWGEQAEPAHHPPPICTHIPLCLHHLTPHASLHPIGRTGRFFLPPPSLPAPWISIFPYFFFFSSPSSGGCLLFPSWLGGSQSHQPQAATRHRRVPARSLRHPPSFPAGSAPPGLPVLPSHPRCCPAAPPAAPRHGQVRASLTCPGHRGSRRTPPPPGPRPDGAAGGCSGAAGGQEVLGTRGRGDTIRLEQSRCGIPAPPPGTGAGQRGGTLSPAR